jgi:hypothetical protein
MSVPSYLKIGWLPRSNDPVRIGTVSSDPGDSEDEMETNDHGRDHEISDLL